jgi:hypothetical protein
LSVIGAILISQPDIGGRSRVGLSSLVEEALAGSA